MAQKAAKPTSTEVLLVAIDMARTQVRVSRCEPRLATTPSVRVAVNEDRQIGGHRHRRLDAIGAKNHKYAKICQNEINNNELCQLAKLDLYNSF